MYCNILYQNLINKAVIYNIDIFHHYRKYINRLNNLIPTVYYIISQLHMDIT